MAVIRTPAVLIHRNGGPEVLEVTEMNVPDPRPAGSAQPVDTLSRLEGLVVIDEVQRR